MRWVVVDGIDGSGKSTVAHWIGEYYQERGEVVHLFVHPSDRWLGRLSRRSLQAEGRLMHTLATIFFIWDVLVSIGKKKGIKSSNDCIIFVRYLMGAAYLPERLMLVGYDFFKKIIDLPRARLLVDVDAKIALSRIETREDRREMFENLEGLQEARRKMLIIAKDEWEVLDNSGDEGRTRRDLNALLDRWEEEGVPLL